MFERNFDRDGIHAAAEFALIKQQFLLGLEQAIQQMIQGANTPLITAADYAQMCASRTLTARAIVPPQWPKIVW